MAFGYYSPVTINHTLVPSTQTNFPVAIMLTDNRLKTLANGGHVTNSSGFDIRPYSNTSLTSPLTYELENLNASTGALVMHVLIASLSSSVDTTIYLAYNNTALTTDGSSTSTWDSSFKAVYHYKDGTTLSATDSTISPANGTIHNATATAGKIDGAGLFNGTTAYIDNGTPSKLALSGACTITSWIRTDTLPTGSDNYQVFVGKGYDGINEAYFCRVDTRAGTLHLAGGSFDGANQYVEWIISGWSNGQWHYVALTYDGTQWRLYADATIVAGPTTLNGPQSSGSLVEVGSEDITGTPSRFFNGVIDEVRISNTNRSSDWITVENNNVVSLGSFLTLGSEVSVSAVGEDQNKLRAGIVRSAYLSDNPSIGGMF